MAAAGRPGAKSDCRLADDHLPERGKPPGVEEPAAGIRSGEEQRAGPRPPGGTADRLYHAVKKRVQRFSLGHKQFFVRSF